MKDPRIIKAEKILVDYSTKVKKDEYVQIVADSAARFLALECYKLCLQRGASPVLKIGLPHQTYTYYKSASEEQLKKFGSLRDLKWMERERMRIEEELREKRELMMRDKGLRERQLKEMKERQEERLEDLKRMARKQAEIRDREIMQLLRELQSDMENQVGGFKQQLRREMTEELEEFKQQLNK